MELSLPNALFLKSGVAWKPLVNNHPPESLQVHAWFNYRKLVFGWACWTIVGDTCCTIWYYSTSELMISWVALNDLVAYTSSMCSFKANSVEYCQTISQYKGNGVISHTSLSRRDPSSTVNVFVCLIIWVRLCWLSISPVSTGSPAVIVVAFLPFDISFSLILSLGIRWCFLDKYPDLLVDESPVVWP